MTNAIFYVNQLTDATYRLVWGYELDATPNNLKWALQQNKTEILKYKFKKGLTTYTILEYAIKCDDLATTRTLIELGANLEYCPLSSSSVLHFYVDCLDENIPPNLDLLNFLIDKISNINIEDSSYFRTTLEYVLEKMARYKEMHWSVVEILLQRGSRITENIYNRSCPFTILKDSYPHQRTHDRIIRNVEEEIVFLERLIKYAELEKKIHNDSNRRLTLEEFEFHTANIRSAFIRAATSICKSTTLSDQIDSLWHQLQKRASFEKAKTSRESIENQTPLISCKKDFAEQRSINCSHLGKNLILYYNYFQTLVKEISFRETLAYKQLKPTLSLILENVDSDLSAALENL